MCSSFVVDQIDAFPVNTLKIEGDVDNVSVSANVSVSPDLDACQGTAVRLKNEKSCRTRKEENAPSACKIHFFSFLMFLLDCCCMQAA